MNINEPAPSSVYLRLARVATLALLTFYITHAQISQLELFFC